MHSRILAVIAASLTCVSPAFADDLVASVKADYDEHLADLWDHFHRNPELSLVEFETAKRMAAELRNAGFDVTEGVGGTGVVAMLENGSGPFVMMRADMDGLPIEEASGLANASRAQQVSPITGETVYTMHACGHDVHITSLVGTARQMAARTDEWSGTLMLIAQPAEERGIGARMMREDNIWERFGTPDYALAFHVEAPGPAGTIFASEGAAYAGADTVDIIVHGVGAHGASPHRSKDPVLIGSQIVVALQTLVSRELAPREPGVVTVGSFHAGTKHNIIPERAHLQLTVRNTNPETRDYLLAGIERIATNIGRAAGLDEDMLPEVIISEESVPPTMNDAALTRQLKNAWREALGADKYYERKQAGMVSEDFPYFSTNPEIRSVYWAIGGTPWEELEAEAAGGAKVASHHSPQFRIAPEPSVRAGVESSVVALLTLMGD